MGLFNRNTQPRHNQAIDKPVEHHSYVYMHIIFLTLNYNIFWIYLLFNRTQKFLVFVGFERGSVEWHAETFTTALSKP